MNRDSVNEYIYWLERFGVIYKKYIDFSEELRKIFTGTLEKLKKILINNNKTIKDEDIIKLLKQLVKEFSIAYEQNKNINKNPEGLRNTDAFKQAIYKKEVAELKKWLIANINDPKLFPNFESIVMFVAKRRQMIEFLKLNNFEFFGKRRPRSIDLKSPLKHSHAEHLFKELSNKEITEKFITYTYKEKQIHLTFYLQMGTNPEWNHTNARFHPELFKIMNELYSKFLSNSNNTSKKDILLELYWLYIQTCPFHRGSAAIGEILFSVLLRKYFECDFLISNGWDGNPLTIPDIHALHYQLDEFKSIFWGQFTNCINDSVNEYIYWLEKFGVIYKKYIDSSEELRKIFDETLEKLKKILRGNIVNTEEDIIRLLKQLVKEFSVAYEQNNNINKNPEGLRKTDAFKQSIYKKEVAELKEWLIANINNKELFPNFESIVMFVAKRRQMIEFLKLGRIRQSKNIDRCVFFEIFGKRRDKDDGFESDVIRSHGEHLFYADKKNSNQIIYKGIKLTRYASGRYNPFWKHTYASFHPELFKIMNELYSEFLSLVNGYNNTSKRDILPELYWLYIQTCPFEAGSAAIGEILFSVLLRIYFECDFLISNGWNGDPLTIPDIHALHYELDHFKSIFWGQFTNCNLKKNSNINNQKSEGNNYFYNL